MVRELPEGFKRGDEVSPDHYQPKQTQQRLRKPKQDDVREVRSLSDAIDYFKAIRPNAVKQKDVKLRNSRVGVTFTEGNNHYLLLFKRDKYRHFGNHYPHIPDEDKQYGILCNLKLVAWTATAAVEIVVVFPNREIYSIMGEVFWDYYEEYKTDVKHAPGEIATPITKWNKW